jgi:hypothetical protein
MHIDITTLNEVDEISCLIAKGLSIIRSGVRKYSRVRTAKNQLLCTKESLNINNSKRYGCNLPITDYEQCPTFEYLRTTKKKSCKNIIVSSQKTNPIYTFLAKRIKFTGKNSISRNHSVKPTKLAKTRKIKKASNYVINNKNNNL